jgi:hypothetical protein
VAALTPGPVRKEIGMSVYVDPIAPYGQSATWRWHESCHMYADTVEELHAMADKLGLKRAWFQTPNRLPHYDLTRSKRRQAVKLGAVQTDFRHVASFIRPPPTRGR